MRYQNQCLPDCSHLKQNLLHILFFSFTKLGQSFPPQKNAKQKVLLSFHSGLLYQNPCFSHFHLCFSLLHLWKVPPSTSKISSINTSHSHEVSFSLHIYSLVSPPRIHMIHGGLQRTQTKDQNGPTILPKINLELMGPSHVGFRLQNHQNQCSIQAGPTNLLN